MGRRYASGPRVGISSKYPASAAAGGPGPPAPFSPANEEKPLGSIVPPTRRCSSVVVWEECAVASPGRRELLVSKAWIQGAVLVILCGFFILGLLAYRTYMAHPPVPKRAVDQQGRVVYTGQDISKGQQ